MAKARRETIPPPPPPPVEEKVILELTPDEAMVVAKILANITGNRQGPRGYAANVLHALQHGAGIAWFDDWPTKWQISGLINLDNA